MRLRGITILTLVVACAPLAGAADVKAEQAALAKLDKAWAAAAAARDVEKSVAYWSDDAQVFAPGQPAIVGKAALRQFVTDSFKSPGFTITWETTQWVVSSSGDIAYGVGTNAMSFLGGDGRTVTEHNRSVTTWRKGPAGWKCTTDIWNAEPGPAQ